MKIRLMSDLHFEFQRMQWPEMADDKDQILVLAGDIDGGKHIHKILEEWAPKVRAIIMVLGNHDYYGTNFPTNVKNIRERTAHLDNVHILDQDSIVIDDVVFIGATLWTNMDNNNILTMYYAEQMMPDYNLVRTGPPTEPWRRKLRATDTTALHNIHARYIFNEIAANKDSGKKIVVVSHHLPSYLCVSDHWKKKTDMHSLNGAFASELFEDIADAKPDLWLFGHTHDSMDVEIADTRAVCNPRGYGPDDLNPSFNPNMVIEI